MRRIPVLVSFVLATIALPAAAGEPPAAGAGWPAWRGPDFDGTVRQARLFTEAGQPGLVVGWKRELGSGYSVPAIAGGRLVAMFAVGEADVAAAFDPVTGKELWRYRIADAYKGHDGSHDGPIASPIAESGRVYGLGPRGHLFALDAATGAAIWTKNIADEHGAKPPYYGFASTPVLVDGVLVVQIGAGEGKTVAGFSAADGKLLWTTGDDSIGYGSPIAATVAGRRQVLSAGKKTLLGLDAATGKVLWSFTHDGDNAAMGGETVVPVPAGEGRFLLHNKMDSSTMIAVTASKGEDWKVEPLWTKNSIRGTYVLPVYHDGYLYGMTGRLLTCVDAATGETKWRSREPGDGFPTLVGHHLVLITKPGTLHVAEASPEAYREVARLDLFQEHSWSAVAWADGHLYARSMAHLARVDITEAAREPAADRAWIAGTRFGRFLDEAAKAADPKGAVDAFLAGQKSFPIVEDGGIVHFVYRGEAADVGIVGDMIGFRREDPMTRLAGTDLFHYSTRLEPDAAVAYGFLVDYAKATPDPRNPRKAQSLFGEVSWFAMPSWREPGYLREADASRQGRLEDLDWESPAFEGKKQPVRVYVPAGYDASGGRRYPVLYFHGGKDALEQGALKNALDNLIGSSIEPLIAVFILPREEDQRRGPDSEDRYTKMLVTELVPKIDGKYRTIASPAGRASAGAGEGANAALTGAFKHPDLFGRLGSLSVMSISVSEFTDVVKSAQEQPVVIYMDWGTYHMRSPHEAWDMARANRDLWGLLRERGFRPTGGETPDGFGWGCWRGHLDRMLATLFPLPRAEAGGL